MQLSSNAWMSLKLRWHEERLISPVISTKKVSTLEFYWMCPFHIYCLVEENLNSCYLKYRLLISVLTQSSLSFNIQNAYLGPDFSVALGLVANMSRSIFAFFALNTCAGIGSKTCELDNFFPLVAPRFGSDTVHELCCYMYLVFRCLTALLSTKWLISTWPPIALIDEYNNFWQKG